jgi:hypothetical protein
MNDPDKGHGPEPASRLVKEKGDNDAYGAEKDPLFCIAGMEQWADQRSNDKTCKGEQADEESYPLQGDSQFILEILMKLEEDCNVAEIEEDDHIEGKELFGQDFFLI